MKNSVQEYYGNRLRTRVCAVITNDSGLLMINHAGLGVPEFWAPPGGGIEVGERATDALVREVKEETGLIIEPGKFLLGYEFIGGSLHAVELFFEATVVGGQLTRGADPETGSPDIIRDAQFLTWSEIDALPESHKHGIFRYTTTAREISRLSGYFGSK